MDIFQFEDSVEKILKDKSLVYPNASKCLKSHYLYIAQSTLSSIIERLVD